MRRASRMSGESRGSGRTEEHGQEEGVGVGAILKPWQLRCAAIFFLIYAAR